MTRKTDIAATPMVTWSAPSPPSPAPSARRSAALGLDRSVRPSKLAHRAAFASRSMYRMQFHLHRNLLHKISDIPWNTATRLHAPPSIGA